MGERGWRDGGGGGGALREWEGALRLDLGLKRYRLKAVKGIERFGGRKRIVRIVDFLGEL